MGTAVQICCCKRVCSTCHDKFRFKTCPLCRTPPPKSAAEDLARLRRHVENDVPEAMLVLGMAYEQEDFGLKRSDKKAVKLYKRAVERGNVACMLNLGKCYEHGAGVKLDKKKAMQLFRMAADRGAVSAYHNIAVFLESTDSAESFRMLKLAAQQGLADAQCGVACAFELGRWNAFEMERDLGEAKRWFELAAASRQPGRGREFARGALATGRLDV
jgi:hypothetical protein